MKKFKKLSVVLIVAIFAAFIFNITPAQNKPIGSTGLTLGEVEVKAEVNIGPAPVKLTSTSPGGIEPNEVNIGP